LVVTVAPLPLNHCSSDDIMLCLINHNLKFLSDSNDEQVCRVNWGARYLFPIFTWLKALI
jgi:hypothetical protein